MSFLRRESGKYKPFTPWVAKATESNRHTTRMKIRGSVVSLIFHHSPEAKKTNKHDDKRR